MNELPHSSCIWFIEKRNIIKTDRWDGTKTGREACPACGGSGRIWFEEFVDWTCVCLGGYKDPVNPFAAEWWKYDTTKYTSWLNELLWRWQTDRYWLANKRLEKIEKIVKDLLQSVNDRYPDKNPKEWNCKYFAELDKLVNP